MARLGESGLNRHECCTRFGGNDKLGGLIVGHTRIARNQSTVYPEAPDLEIFWCSRPEYKADLLSPPLREQFPQGIG